MSTHISVPPHALLERILTLEIVRVTERAAVSSARLRGHGNEKAADQAAVDAMRRELNKLPIEGTIVIGEGERDEAPMLFIGEKVGLNAGPQVDIAVDPLEGTTLCAKNMPGSFSTMAMRTYPSPCSPKPTPGETATPDFSTIRVANCMLPTLRKASGSGTQANIEASGG
ncbi:fructose-bisphosphatase class II, partial [Bradyrhizobium ottawaense]|uniref:fructose-bisphosphatase class II n=1 Tax=Bradyrhizobium ottawaense TaxID=931866 RepID=UPI0030C6FDAD